MIYVKVHKGPSDVIAICDESLIGQVLQEGKLHFEVSAYFYKGALKTEDEVRQIMKQHSNLNIIGKQSIALALELHLVTQKSLRFIQGVPHAQIITC